MADRLIDDKAVADTFGINRASVWKWVKLKRIPAPVISGKRFSRWSEQQVQAVIEKMKTAERQEATS